MSSLVRQTGGPGSFRLAAFLFAGILTAGCSGGSSSLTPATVSKPGPSADQLPVTFTMHWNAPAPSSSPAIAPAGGRPQYVSASALSVSVSVNGGTPQVLNSPATTLTIDAPAGTDTFVFETYDETNAQGNVLSQATVSQSIVSGQANHISAVLNGVIASIGLSIASPNFAAGTATSTAISATGMDADGNAIVGSSNYSSPIVLSIDDPNDTKTLSLSSTAIASPSGSANLVYNGGTLVSASVVAQSGSVSATATVTPTPTIYEYAVAGEPQYIAQDGTGGDMFYTDSNNTIGKMTLTGTLAAAYTIPTSSSNPQGITYGENGNMWFAEYNSSKIAQITPSGTFTEYGTLFGSDSPEMVTDRGDDTIWYTGYGGNHVGYVSETTGAAGETTMSASGSGPWGIAEGPDGNLYVTENLNDAVAYLSSLFTNPIPQIAIKSGSQAEQLVKGPDNNMWFTMTGLNSIGKLDPYTQALTYYPTYSASSVPVGIAVGADGALWYTESGIGRIGRITTSGVGSEYVIPNSNAEPTGIAGASDGSIWFCESNAGKIGRLVL